jgi:hypothetical protein
MGTGDAPFTGQDPRPRVDWPARAEKAEAERDDARALAEKAAYRLWAHGELLWPLPWQAARGEGERQNRRANKGNEMSKKIKGRPVLGEHIEKIAKATHEVNRAFCEGMGDASQVPWIDAPLWQKKSARLGVSAICQNLDMTPEQSHKGWLELKKADGWKFGPTKDAVAKTHPCMVPYEELPNVQRAKDALFTTTVKALLEHMLKEEEG